MAPDITKVIDYVNKTFDRPDHGDSVWIDEQGKRHTTDTGYALEWWRDCMAPELARVFRKCDKTAPEPVAVALTLEEWRTVLHWLQYGADYHAAKKWEWLATCKDKALAGFFAAEHEKGSKEAAALHNFIEENIMGPFPPMPEDPEQPARWIWDESPEIDFDGYMCSKCGNKFNHKYYTNVCEFKYCPHCGQRMNEEAGY